MVAHRDDINISSHKFCKFSTQAELLSIFVNLNNVSVCISTFYRVGTLSYDNFSNVRDYLRCLVKSKGFKRHILIGDLNFPTIDWPSGATSNTLERDFVDLLCGDLGHSQLIHSPTHTLGNIRSSSIDFRWGLK